MVLALSFAAFNIQAAEKGAAFGTNFLNQPKPVARIAESPRVIQLPTKLALARVKGYAINSATVTSTAPTATISASASTVEANTSFTITVSGTSASGLSSLWWFVEDTANRTFHEISGSVNGESKNLSAAQDFSAGYGSESYSYTRTVKISNPGVYEFISNSRDRLYPVPGEPHQASEGAGMGRQTITVTAAQTGQCAGPGLAADVYGGPNHICCTGLVLQGGLCNVPPTTSNTCVAPYHGLTPDGRCVWSCSVGTEPSNVAPYECVCRLGFTETSTDQFGRRVCTKPGGPTEGDHPSEVNNHTEIIVCHKAGPENYVEIKTDKNGWLNGHSQHEGDYIKTGPRPCRPPKITVEPLSSETGSLTKNIEDPKDALIRKLQERIQRLEIRLSQVEQEVIEREKNRETKVDTTLTKRVSGNYCCKQRNMAKCGMLIQQHKTNSS
jgi:hypothetical protein